MKKTLTMILAIALTGCANSQPTMGYSKHDLEFRAQSAYPVKRVEWIVVDDVNAVCNGFAPIRQGRNYIACTRFNDTACKVYTGRDISLSILGHEMRHCFEGHWHQ